MSEMEEIIKAKIDAAVDSAFMASRIPELIPPEGYEYGWARYTLGGYRNNNSPERDIANLNDIVSRGWQPVTKSPHPDLPLSKHGYVLHGDTLLVVRAIPVALDGPNDIPRISHTERDEKFIYNNSTAIGYDRIVTESENCMLIGSIFNINDYMVNKKVIFIIPRENLYNNYHEFHKAFPHIFKEYIPYEMLKEGEKVIDVNPGFIMIYDISTNYVYIIKEEED